MLLLLFLIYLLFLHSNTQLDKFTNMDITIFNVGQADSQIIELYSNDNKYRIMVDFGKYNIPNISNKTFDLCVVTHSHMDHYSSECQNLNLVYCETIMISNDDIDCINNYIDKYNPKVITAEINDDFSINNVKIIVKSVKHSCSDDKNKCSIGLYFEFDKFKYFTAGDLPNIEESQLDINKINVFKVSHHGSSTSSKEDFLNKIQPDVCIISSELTTKDCIPTVETIENLKLECNEILMTGELNNKCNNYNDIYQYNIHNNGDVKIKYLIDDNYYYIKSNKIDKKYYL